MTRRLARTGLMAAFVAGASLSAATSLAKPFEEYLRPTPITCSPLSSASWGVAGVLPRDLCNGIESAKGARVHPDYYYWDGQIIRAKDGKYHLFMSTFSGNTNFGTSWQSSDAYHAISQTSVFGPYERQDYIYTNNGSHKGHNVSAVELPDGSYAVIVSEIVPFTIYKSSSLDGPWTSCQPTTQVGASNISLVPRHDGKFQIVERNGTIAIADTLCGTYVKQKPTCSYTQAGADSIYPKRTSIPGVSNPSFMWQEDPHIWRSAGTYHVIYSGSGDRVGWHVYSADGINWKDNGYAWSPRDYQKIFCYEGTTTCSQWYKMERPGVVLQNGHPTHITWAVSDVDKDNQVLPGTNHGTKIVVVPFDGVAFDNDFGVGGGANGGASNTGGAPSTGGARASGGSSGAGGAKATGGSSGAGGAKATGGSGGTSGSSSNTGGVAHGGGPTGASGGATSMPGTGGQPSTSSSGGSANVASGGDRALGGTSASGGTNGNGGTPAAGSSNNPGNPADSGDNGGCGCRTAGGARSNALAALGIVALVGLRARRRRAKSRCT
ncbi:MAG TPA: MYXO-CTERM sorting domain-containing protein [Polyangiaceae bacterium]|nr:MYXO-CTERM sorting domain-containing protein [Polyangiaceae bacterium]